MKIKLRPKSQKGFTLVEVIVVAVIVAAMAAVAVPMYLSYVTSARQNSASNAAGSIASFCGACRNSGGTCTVVSLPNTGGGSMSCPPGPTTIQIPGDIIVLHQAPNGANPGRIRGRHKEATVTEQDSAAFVSFNY